MLFNIDAEPVVFIIWLILATIIVFLVIYIVVLLLESKTKASDKWVMILILAFLIVLVLPIVLNAVTGVLDAIGGALEEARDAIDDPTNGGGHNYLILLAPVIGFLILLVLVKFLIDIPWDNAVWVALLILFVLYVLFTLIPELYTFIYEYVPE